MASIATLKGNHNSQIRVQTAQDSIAQTTVADLLDAITDEHALRGCPTVANTTALATLPNTETKMVYVSNVGHFFDTGVGPADGNLIFSGVAGRFWKLIIPDKVKMQLDQVNNTTDLNKPISTATAAALANKVTVVPGKQLSTEDYTTTEKGQLASVVAVFGTSPDGDSVVNKITEVLAVFNTYPEGVDLNTVLAGKLDLTGGTMSGNLLVPDQLVSDNSQKAINSKFVHDFEAAANNNFDEDQFEGKFFPVPGVGDPPVGHVDNPIHIKASILGGGGALDTVPTNGSTNGVESNGVFDALATKQDTLVSATNIKTINGASILGAGDLAISGGSGAQTVLTTVTANNTQEFYEFAIGAYTAYKMLEIRFDNWNMGSTGRELFVDVKIAGAYQTGTNAYKYTLEDGGGQGLSTDVDFHKVGNFMKCMDGSIYISNPFHTTRQHIIRSKGAGKDGSDGISQREVSSMPDNTGAITHIKVYTSGTGFSINIEEGTFTLIGHS